MLIGAKPKQEQLGELARLVIIELTTELTLSGLRVLGASLPDYLPTKFKTFSGATGWASFYSSVILLKFDFAYYI